ncbi:hypothetical protein BH09SUM1_BH09SUM1_09720 [soil metagenome]
MADSRQEKVTEKKVSALPAWKSGFVSPQLVLVLAAMFGIGAILIVAMIDRGTRPIAVSLMLIGSISLAIFAVYASMREAAVLGGMQVLLNETAERQKGISANSAVSLASIVELRKELQGLATVCASVSEKGVATSQTLGSHMEWSKNNIAALKGVMDAAKEASNGMKATGDGGGSGPVAAEELSPIVLSLFDQVREDLDNVHQKISEIESLPGRRQSQDVAKGEVSKEEVEDLFFILQTKVYELDKQVKRLQEERLAVAVPENSQREEVDQGADLIAAAVGGESAGLKPEGAKLPEEAPSERREENASAKQFTEQAPAPLYSKVHDAAGTMMVEFAETELRPVLEQIRQLCMEFLEACRRGEAGVREDDFQRKLAHVYFPRLENTLRSMRRPVSEAQASVEKFAIHARLYPVPVLRGLDRFDREKHELLPGVAAPPGRNIIMKVPEMGWQTAEGNVLKKPLVDTGAA